MKSNSHNPKCESHPKLQARCADGPRWGAVGLSLLLLGAIAGRAAPSPFPEPAANDTAGFKAIFDGNSLEGWDADPKCWRAQDGILVGETTAETNLKANTFAIWKGGAPGDFEFKAQFRITATGNSGVNYRSERVPEVPFALKGYQADIDGAMQWTGQNYEERGRGFLALRGQITRAAGAGKPVQLGTMGDRDALKTFIKADDWNEIHIIARGNVLTHIVNGHAMCVLVDEDAAARKTEGLLGLQIHVGPPMKVEYRNLLLKTLPPVGK